MREYHKQGPNIKAEPSSDLSTKQEPPDDCLATYVISKAEENPVSNDQLRNVVEPVSAKPNLEESSNIPLCNTITSNISPEICTKSSFTNITDHLSSKLEQENPWVISINKNEEREDIQVMLNDDQNVSMSSFTNITDQVSSKLEQENAWVISINKNEEREDIQVMLNDDQNVSRNELQVMVKESDIKVKPESSEFHIDNSIATCQNHEVIHTTVKSDYADIENVLDQKVSYPTSQDSAAFSSIIPLAHSLKSNPDNVDSTSVESTVQFAPSALTLSAPATLTPSTPVPVSIVQSTTVSTPSPLTQVPSRTLLPRRSSADEQPRGVRFQ